MSEPKKISFGFAKLTKHSSLSKPKVSNEEEKVEYIDCFDGKSIICKDQERKNLAEATLVIPVQPNSYKGAAVTILSTTNEEQKDKVKPLKGIMFPSHQFIETPETLEMIAAKEILEGLKGEKPEQLEDKLITLPFGLQQSAHVSDKESSLDDYEAIPVSAYGLAMLRGMGWKPDKGIGKCGRVVSTAAPVLRTKGMGLGAEKQAAPMSGSVRDEPLELVPKAPVRVTGGPHKHSYGEIEGFNEDSGRVIVKLAQGGAKVSVNEGALKVVSREEFRKSSRVLNISDYEQYKEMEEAPADNRKTEKKSSISDDRSHAEVDSPRKHKSSSRKQRSRSRSPVRSKR